VHDPLLYGVTWVSFLYGVFGLAAFAAWQKARHWVVLVMGITFTAGFWWMLLSGAIQP
jgi:hypothetical protein